MTATKPSMLPDQSRVSSEFQSVSLIDDSLDSFEASHALNASSEGATPYSQYEGSITSERSSLPDLDHHQHRSFHGKIGRMGLFILVAGTICLLGTPGFLIFLWQGSRQIRRHEEPGQVWTSIVFSNWATRSVTICATVIRSAITAQTALITSMVASLYLESAGANLEDLPLLSVLRAIRVSPINLLLPNLLRGRGRRLIAVLCAAAIIISSVLTIASQLTSTILLSDFQVIPIPGPKANENLVVGTFVIGGDSNNYGYGSAPANWWRFSEYKGSPRNVTAINDTTFTDTGLVYRAAIPSSDQVFRENLRFYEGTANTWDARVICLNPKLSHISFTTNDYYDTAELHGIVKFDNTDDNYLGLKFAQSNNNTDNLSPFTCTVPYRDGASICVLDSKISLQPPSADDQPLYDQMTGRYVLVRWNLANETKSESDKNFEDLKTLQNISTDTWPTGWQQRHRASWTELVSPSGKDLFSISACFTMDGLPTTGEPVAMSANSSALEPKLGYTRSASKPLLASQEPTLQIRGQMGAYKCEESLEERGVLSLQFKSGKCHNRFIANTTTTTTPSSPSDDNLELRKPNNTNNVITGGLGTALSRARTLPLSVSRQLITVVDNSERKVQQAHACLVLDVLATTDNPALAVQALSTALIQMLHFDEDYRWNTTSPAAYTVAAGVTIPASRTGLFGVVAMVAAHLVVLGAIILPMFLRHTNVTLLGNMWLAVAQIMSDRTGEILAHSHGLKDSEVEKVLHGPRKGPGLPGIIRRRHNGRAEFGPR
ncbi:hypothetical protein PG995_011810 [Apiospora arundinis]